MRKNRIGIPGLGCTAISLGCQCSTAKYTVIDRKPPLLRSKRWVIHRHPAFYTHWNQQIEIWHCVLAFGFPEGMEKKTTNKNNKKQ